MPGSMRPVRIFWNWIETVLALGRMAPLAPVQFMKLEPIRVSARLILPVPLLLLTTPPEKTAPPSGSAKLVMAGRSSRKGKETFEAAVPERS